MDGLSESELEAVGVMGIGLSSPESPGETTGLWTKDGLTGPIADLNIREVKEIIDLLMMRRTELSQSYVDVTRQAENCQKEGFLHLAKARYVQGSQVVSKDRLPSKNSEEVAALVHVNVRDTDEQCTVDQSILRFPQRSLVVNSDTAAQTKLLQGMAGALPPAAVKEAQKCFKRALELHLDRQNIQEELAMAEKKYEGMMKMTRSMIGTEKYTVGDLIAASPSEAPVEQ